jgi:predicted metallopeptidase
VASRVDAIWEGLSVEVSPWYWRLALSDRIKADIHEVMHVWTLDSLVAAHRILDAAERHAALTTPSPSLR